MKITTTLFGEINYFQWQAKTPVRERLEWLTDVIPARDGGEDRHANRSVPRQTFEYQTPLSAFKKTEGFNVLMGGKDLQWYFTLWTELQEVGTVTSSQTSVSCATTSYSFYDDSLAVLYNGLTFEVVEIESYDAFGVELYSAPANTVENAYLAPIKRGWIKSIPKISENGYESTITTSFIVQDDISKIVYIPPQYNSEDVYYGLPFEAASGRFARDIISNKKFVDFKLGRILSKATWDNNKQITPIKMTLFNQADISTYKNFFYRRAGKYRPFYTNLDSQDLILQSTGTLTNTVRVNNDQLVNYSGDRRHIVFTDRDCNHYPHEILSYTRVDDDTVELTLNSAVGIDASEVQLVSWLGLQRLNNDALDIRWIGNGVAEFKCSMLELES